MQQPKGTPPVVQYPPKPVVPVIEYERPGTGAEPMHDIAFLAVRVLALWGFMGSIGLVTVFFPHLFVDRSTYSDILLPGDALLVGMGIPVAAWVWSRPLARLLLSPANRPGEAAFAPQSGDLLAAAFAVLGAYFIISSSPQLVYNIYYSLTDQFHWAYVVQPVITTVTGAGLFLGSHGLARFWQRLRSPNPMYAPEHEMNQPVSETPKE